MNPLNDGPTLLDHLADMDAIAARALAEAEDAADAIAAIRAAAGSYGNDASTLRREGADDWALFYTTVARELTKVADALARARKDGRP